MNTALKILILSYVLSITAAIATTFSPVPLDRQLRESDGVIHAQFKGANYKKLPNGEIVTMGSFKIIKSIGLRNSDIVNKNNFVLMYPGGTWQNKGYHVHGSPKFVMNEESVLILKKTEIGYRIKGLNLGKYSFERDSITKNIYLSSSVFPNHPKLGKIMFSDFQHIIENHYDENFSIVNSDKYVHFSKKRKMRNTKESGRKPASFEEDMQSVSKDNKLHVYWLVILLGALGVISLHLARRSKRK